MTERWRPDLRPIDDLAPNIDLLARARELAPSARSPIHWPMRAGTIVTALAIAAGGVAFLFVALWGPFGQPSGAATYRDPTGTWKVTYPARFHEDSIPDPHVPGLGNAVGVSYQGIWIANFNPLFHSFGPASTNVPSGGALVELYRMEGGNLSYEHPDVPDSTFPLSLSDLKVVPGSYGGTDLEGTIVGNGERYFVTVRWGEEASKKDKNAAASIVRSFRFLPLQQGSIAGEFFVLEGPSAYPIGSVTRFDAANVPQIRNRRLIPFYLVHVTKGFFAISWPNDRANGYKGCDVRYDPGSHHFSCPNGARWALDGSVLVKPAGAPQKDRLDVPLVRISLDGHVLVDTFSASFDTSTDLRLT